jgi:PH (Pleckstrin Homology) domain-containing protein
MPSEEGTSRDVARAEEVRLELLAAFPSPLRVDRHWGGTAVESEIDELHHLLADDERIEMASVGTIEGRGVLIVATDRRLVVFDGGYGRRTFYEYAYADVERVEWRSGLRTGEIVVVPRSGVGVRVKEVMGKHVKPVGMWLTRRVADERRADAR